MNNMKLSIRNFVELDNEQILNITGGHCEISMDRESAIMASDFLEGVFWGFFKGLFDL